MSCCLLPIFYLGVSKHFKLCHSFMCFNGMECLQWGWKAFVWVQSSKLIHSRFPDAGLQWNTASPSSEPPVTSISEKDNSWLYTLDPILVTIIVMSSLGVLLGAVCAGLLLYCTCSYSGLSSRSSTTLENYNFELYDGLKHKVKLNQQRCCTEAWAGSPARHFEGKKKTS